MKIVALLLLCVCCMCLSSDKSDQLPSPNHDNVTNNITITNNSLERSPMQSPKRKSRYSNPGPKHPQVEMAHELARRQKEEDDFITCCCFFKMKKLPLH